MSQIIIGTCGRDHEGRAEPREVVVNGVNDGSADAVCPPVDEHRSDRREREAQSVGEA